MNYGKWRFSVLCLDSTFFIIVLMKHKYKNKMTAKRKTSCCPSWECEFKYLRKAPNDKYWTFCVACNKTFLTDGSGKSQVRSHMPSPTHLDKEKQLKNQATFCKYTDDGAFIVKKKNFALSSDKQIMKAEIWQVLKTVGSNFSFASPSGDGDRFWQMFPDSKIAKGFSQNETKMYVIKLGLTAYFKESLKNDFYCKAFCFKLEETTTNQTKKQFDGFVQYWSKSQNKVTMAYCGSLFVDHCPAYKLVEHFFTFIEKIGLDNKFMLHLGMDGPNVHWSFKP